MSESRIDSRRFTFLIALAVWLVSVVATSGLGLTDRLENILLDWNLRSLADRHPPDPRIVLLDIDEPTLAAMAPEHGRYPWSRAVFGQLLEGLSRQQPAAVIFDILFIEPHKDHVEDDLYLIRTAQRLPNVFFPMALLAIDPAQTPRDGFRLRELPGVERGAQADPEARAPMLLPLPGLRDTGRLGSINITADADGVVRYYPLYQSVDGWHIPSLPARVARHLGVNLPASGEFSLLWHGPAYSYRALPFHEVFADLERAKPRRAPDEFRDKIIIIGASAAGLHDLKLTPMGANFPGPEIIATALDNLLHGDRIAAAPAWTGPLLTAALLLVLTAAFVSGLGIFRLGLLAAALTFATVAASWAALIYARLAVPVVGAILFGGWFYYLLAALRAYLLERRDRQRVTTLFSRFLDPRVVSGLVARGEAGATLGGQKRAVTVLFSDIRGFTTLSERKTPQEIVDLLNRYFSLQVEIIFRHQGTLDKYIGDAIMAFWGAPTEQADHARRALLAARDMEQALLKFKQELGDEGKQFDIGIGLHSGEAVVGFIGSPEHRQDYTVIGDTVNTASRIEGATKERARILVSDATRQAVGEICRFRDHGSVKLKGKEEALHLYEPVWETAS
jgi:adenylate cyclase